jgi:hypothetical protein
MTRAMETLRDQQPVAEATEQQLNVRASPNLDKMA